MRVERLVWLPALVAASCGVPKGERPRDTLTAFAAALDAQQYSRAYHLMSSRYRARHTEEEFTAALGADPADAKEVATAIRAHLSDLEVHAEVPTDLDERLDLVIDGASWRVDSAPVTTWSQETPRDALRTFLRAVDRRRYDVLLRLVPDTVVRGTGKPLTPDALRADWEGPHRPALDAVVAALRQHVADPIDETGDTARLIYGDAGDAAALLFRREDGVWKIERFQ